MRLYPPVPVDSKVSAMDDVFVFADGTVVKKGREGDASSVRDGEVGVAVG